ncbi:MAG: tetratricopeptide repeat protein [Lunatimonas sp.]|uniref:tetratricopeptide repeat protein n=1 Tax=Lunatimonas sp. TaxID=2060141 RepID=UPI00263ABCD2|nr:tetratricopeptide repeat protein [Lunatimonas sp.]MCC5939056.1 tetratricopeptide repeat protein [Lunatimonas sp.]
MKSTILKRIFSYLFVFLPASIAVIGCVGLIALHLFFPKGALPLIPGMTGEMVNIPLGYISLGFGQLTLETQNYLLYQVFESVPPMDFPLQSQLMGLLVWILFSLGIVLISGFNRYPFIASMAAAIFLLVVSGVNDLGLTALGQNSGLLIALGGLLLPAILIHTFFPYAGLETRTPIILPVALITWFTLIYFSPVPAPTLLLAENISLTAMVISAIFLVYIGHSVVSSIYVLLAKLNQGIGIKIIWHFLVLSIAYIVFVALLYMQLTGELRASFPLPSVFWVFILAGALGFWETTRKIRQIPQPYTLPLIGKGVYLIGFAISSLVWLKADLTVNAPMADFLQHILLYAQLGFGILFFLYLIANFLGIMNTGSAIEKIMYRPPFFPYFHMRMGALLSVVVLAIYSDGIVAVQVGSASTNLSADYYQTIGKKQEAAILYEYSFDRYRNNPKNLNAVAHYYFEERQPTPATQVLMRSFDERPTVNNIVLLTSRLHNASKSSEALFYLQEGLKYFPGNPYLLNNLAILKSKLQQPIEARELLKSMNDQSPVRDANLQALYAIHGLDWEDQDLTPNLPGQINRLANYNLVAEIAPFELPTDSIRVPSLINRATLRNQWSNVAHSELYNDLDLLDALLAHEVSPSLAAELLETQVIRNYREGQLNDLIATLGSLARNYSGSAGFYLSMQAKVLAGQMDLPKAAEVITAAEINGFSKIEQDMLPLLYFGGQQEAAIRLAENYAIPFPNWMKWDEAGKLMENDTVTLAKGLADLLAGTKKSVWQPLEKIQATPLKAFYAIELLLRKSHWFEDSDFQEIRDILESAYSESENLAKVHSLLAFFQHDHPLPDEKLNPFFPYKTKSRVANAYWTPLVLGEVRNTEDPIDAYNLLHTATRFNRDPLLWLELVKFSRRIGQDAYASNYLAEMGAWLSTEELIDLQIKYLP